MWQLEKHLLHSIHVYVIELPNSESLEEILDWRHTVAASQLGAWVVQYECKAHLLLGREATLRTVIAINEITVRNMKIGRHHSKYSLLNVYATPLPPT